MEKLVSQLKIVQATAFALYLKAHNYHWNIEGPNFAQYHAFLDSFYNEVWGSVDAIAEHIRTTGAYVPGSLSRFKELSVVEDETNIPSASVMLTKLRDDNEKMIVELKKAHEAAEAVKAFGIINYLEDRIDIHFKHAWMLRSITKV